MAFKRGRWAARRFRKPSQSLEERGDQPRSATGRSRGKSWRSTFSGSLSIWDQKLA